MLEDRVQAACTNILGAVIDLSSKPGDLGQRVVSESERHFFGAEKIAVLGGQRMPGLAKNAHEVALGERLQLDAERESSLQLGNQIRRLTDMEGTGSDEEDMVRLHHPIFRVDGRPLDNRQKV